MADEQPAAGAAAGEPSTTEAPAAVEKPKSLVLMSHSSLEVCTAPLPRPPPPLSDSLCLWLSP